MKSIPVCPLEIYSFVCADDLLNEVYNEIKNLKYRKNINNYISNDHYKNPLLLDWFDQCLEEVRKVKFTNLVEKFVITNCWANKTLPLQFHHEHSHSNSVISGVFYLTSHDSGEIEFLELDQWLTNGQQSILKITDHTPYISSKINPESGTLILFPSTLVHKTSALKRNENCRYSISFNTFPSGKIFQKNISTEITLHPLSVREL